MAIACGVNFLLAPHMSIALTQAGMLSPNSRCKTFDAAANGYVRGEGCGLIVLKRLETAQRDGDALCAVASAGELGVDVECHRAVDSAALAQLDSTDLQAAFFPKQRPPTTLCMTFYT